MSLAPTRSVSSATTTPLTLGVTDPDAIAVFLRGVPLDAAFWRRFQYPCDHCQETGTTACGALWRVSLANDCTELYYLHSRCLLPYKAAHTLQSVEGRLPLRRPAADAPALPWDRHEDDARIRRENDEAGVAERDAHQDAARRRQSALSPQGALLAVADALSAPSATWRTQTVTDPADGPLTTLYSPDGRPTAYAAGVDDAALRRVADRLNKRAPAVRA